MLALGLLVLAALLFVALTFWRRRSPASFRTIDAYERLNRSVGLAVCTSHLDAGVYSRRVAGRRWLAWPCCESLQSAHR
jgi:hypothetical protein